MSDPFDIKTNYKPSIGSKLAGGMKVTYQLTATAYKIPDCKGSGSVKVSNISEVRNLKCVNRECNSQFLMKLNSGGFRSWKIDIKVSGDET